MMHLVTLVLLLTVFEVGTEVAFAVVGPPPVSAKDKDLLALLKPTVTGREYELEKVGATGKNEEGEGETVKMLSTEVDVEPGGVATLHFKVPASAKGEWQLGCFIPGHYEAGMKGQLIVQ